MSIDAIIMMVIAMLVLWGGLALAIVNLNRTADPDDQHDAESAHRDL